MTTTIMSIALTIIGLAVSALAAFFAWRAWRNSQRLLDELDVLMAPAETPKVAQLAGGKGKFVPL